MPKHQLRKPRLASSTKDNQKLFDAARELGSLLPKSASFFVALSGVAYYSGWREAKSYYGKLGAPWIVSSIPRFSFIELSAGMMAAIAIFTYAAFYSLATEKRDKKKVFWGGSVTLGIAYFLPLVPSLLPNRVAPATQWLFDWAHAGLVYVAAGMLIGEAIVRLQDEKLKWSLGVAEVIQMVVVYALWMAPADIGIARAEYNLAAPDTTLPLVTISGGSANERWRLVEVLGQMALLAEFHDNKSLPIFRVVLLKDISAIQQPYRLNEKPTIPSQPASGKSAGPAQSTYPADRPRS